MFKSNPMVQNNYVLLFLYFQRYVSNRDIIISLYEINAKNISTVAFSTLNKINRGRGPCLIETSTVGLGTMAQHAQL